MTPITKPGFALITYLVAVFLAPPAGAFLVSEDEQRRDFLTALELARRGDSARFRELRERLDGYLLKGYLDYAYLKSRLANTPKTEIRAFLAANSDAPTSDLLRRQWLRDLAARGDWDTFGIEFKGIDDDPELLCTWINRQLQKGEQQASLMNRIEPLWLTGRRLPTACQPVFEAWRRAGHMTSDLVWARIQLAMERGNLGLASAVARYLEPGERIWVTRWQSMYRDPVRELSRFRYPIETPVARMIVKQGVVRLAYRDPEQAMLHWQRLKQEHQFFGEDENYVLRYLGILAAQEHLPVALQWLSAVAAEPDDESLLRWRVKAALQAERWDTALRFISALPEGSQREPRWQYWRARALDSTGKPSEADPLYRTIARDRSFYGFLAADHLDTDYSMQHVAITVTPAERAAMLDRPGVQMARELFQIGQIVEARRQWNWVTREMTNRELQVAAVLAREWGWHDRAIFTVGQSDHLDDLELRFPVLYRDAVEANAAETGIDVGLLYGVIRQESAFVADARSPAGALGLMQLMPATGRLTGRKLKLRVRGNSTLLDAETNLRLGASYLKEVLARYNGNEALAAASYNAGPHRVRAWVPKENALDAAIWVENIPYEETRGYVKNVLAYAAVYEHRLGLRPRRLRDRMPMVEAAAPD